MARIHPIVPSFAAGELSPLLYGRVDFQKYAFGCRTLENFIVHPHGPAKKRPGTRFVSEVKDSTHKTRLIPFEFSTTQAYIIEFQEGQFRFYKDGGLITNAGVPVEVVHTYTETQIPAVKYAQSADTLYICHPAHPVRKLTRTSHTAWTLKDVKFRPGAMIELGRSPATTLTLSAVTGLNIVVTASAATWQSSDVGRVITHGDGRALIRAFTSNTVVNADVTDDFSGVGPLSGWRLLGSPVATLTPTANVRSAGRITTLNLSAPATGFTAAEDVGKLIRCNEGVCKILEVVSVSQVRAEILSDLTDTSANPPGAWSLEEPAWTTARGFPGAVGFFQQRLCFAGTNEQPNTIWGSLAGGGYENFALGPNDDDSFEFAIAANSVVAIKWIIPARVLLVGAVAGEFKLAGGSDSPVTPTNVLVTAETSYGSNDVAPLRVGNVALFVARSGRELREFVYDYTNDNYVAPDLMILSEHLTKVYTITEMAHAKSPRSVVYCVRSDGALLAMAYERAHEVVAWSRLFTGSTAVDDDDNVVAGDGVFESVAVIPHPSLDRDQVWVAVKRLINGVYRRYVEYFDDKGDSGNYYDGMQVDAGLSLNHALPQVSLTLSALTGLGVTATASSAIFAVTDIGREIVSGNSRGTIVGFTSPTVVTMDVSSNFTTLNLLIETWALDPQYITGLGHLEAETVFAVGDGAVYSNLLVAGGRVSLTPPANVVEVGLGFTATLRTMRPEVPVSGTSQGQPKHWARIWTRVQDTLGVKIGVDGQVEELPARRAGDPMNHVLDLVTGDLEVNNLGVDADGSVTVVSEEPVPCTVVSVFGTINTGE